MSDKHTFFAVAGPGLEAVLAAELAELGLAEVAAEPGGVAFTGPPSAGWRANLWSRTASRIWLRLAAFPASAFPALTAGAAEQIDWRAVLPGDGPVRVRAATHRSRLHHAGQIARTLEKVIQRARGVRGTTSDAVDALHVSARIVRDLCEISVDTSGELLHRRGYRLQAGRAPMRETLAAAILRLAGWQPEQPLVDPMCGSGTFVIEAALQALRIAPGRQRDFAFGRLGGFDAAAWDAILSEADAGRASQAAAPLVGADRDTELVEVARTNATRAGVDAAARFRSSELSDLTRPGDAPGLVVCNPPFGRRIGKRSALRPLYQRLGATLQRGFPGWRAAILCPDRGLERDLGLLVLQRLPIVTGGHRIDLVLAAT